MLDERKTLLYQLYDERKRTVKEICDILDISRSTLYAYLKRREGKDGGEKKAYHRQS